MKRKLYYHKYGKIERNSEGLKHLESLISQYDSSLERSIIAKNKFEDNISLFMQILKEMKRECLQLPITMFHHHKKLVPAVQSAELVSQPLMSSSVPFKRKKSVSLRNYVRRVCS